jgi:hypothetical protein
MFGCHRALTATLMNLGHEQEARKQAPQLLRISPNYSISSDYPKAWEKVRERKDAPDPERGRCSNDRERMAWMLYKAGVPQ